MDPSGISIRESRDSDEHPNSLAIVLALDVTGSMGSILDVDLLEYAMNRDSVIRNHKNKTLVITCLDHINDYVFTYKDKMIKCTSENAFILRINKILKCHNVLVSRSPCAEGVMEFC